MLYSCRDQGGEFHCGTHVEEQTAFLNGSSYTTSLPPHPLQPIGLTFLHDRSHMIEEKPSRSVYIREKDLCEDQDQENIQVHPLFMGQWSGI